MIPVHRVATIWLLVGSVAFIVYGLTFPLLFPTAWGVVAGLVIVGLFGIHAYWWKEILQSSGLRLTKDGLSFARWGLSWSQIDGFHTHRLFGFVGPPTYVRIALARGVETSSAMTASHLLGTWVSVCGPPLYISTWAFDSDGPLRDSLDEWRRQYG